MRNHEKKFSITTDSRLEYGNEMITPDNNHRDLSLTPQSFNVSGTDNQAFEPFEINFYHKNRKTCQEILNESMEH